MGGGRWHRRKEVANKTKITRPAFEGMWLSLQDSFCRFQTALWFAPVLMSEEEWRPIFWIDRVPASAIWQPSSPMGPAGLYLLRRPEWWISPLFRLVGMLYSVNIYLRFYSKIFESYYTFYQQSPHIDTIIQEFSYPSIKISKISGSDKSCLWDNTDIPRS